MLQPVPTLDIEQKLWNKGYPVVAGLDECGVGSLAGPVVAGACILSPDFNLQGVKDSKQLSKSRRESLYQLFVSGNVAFATFAVDAAEIDKTGIRKATLAAMEGAVALLPRPPDYIVVDGLYIPDGFCKETSLAIAKGDTKSMTIAAASIVAKVERDKMMAGFHEEWPKYGFGKHKGYGSPDHMKAISEHGPSPIHRMTYKPCKNLRSGEKSEA